MDDPRGDMDVISDILRTSTLRRHIASKQLPEVEIAAVFVNDRDGPQFFRGERGRAQPLYLTPAHEGQEPVAWIAPTVHGMITQDRTPYRDDIQWLPLYLAR